jgi:hypothetical protein
MAQIYNKYDSDLLQSNIEYILKDVKRLRDEKIEPYISEVKAIHKICLDFFTGLKRKIYGGLALHLLIKEKDPLVKLYDEDDIVDIDVYSYTPIDDLIELCNLLHDKGFKYVRAREAVHRETYTIYVNGKSYVDITYVPKNIFAKMPFKTIDGITTIHPYFMMIDFLRITTDPFSYWRLFDQSKKAFERMSLLEKYHPLPYNALSISTSVKPENLSILNFLINYIADNNLICVGLYTYNLFLVKAKNSSKSKFTNTDTIELRKFKYIDPINYEIISDNYKEDAIKLIEILKEKYGDQITYKEYSPYFQFIGNSVNIYYNDNLVCTIYDNNKRCIPYNKVKDPVINKEIHIGTFSLVLMYIVIKIMWSRILNDDEMRIFNHQFASNLIEIRNIYYNLNPRANILSNDIFSDFKTQIRGIPLLPERERLVLGEERKKKNKAFMFSYDPVDGKLLTEEEITKIKTFIFQNSSGNPIIHKKCSILYPEVIDLNSIAKEIPKTIEEKNEEKNE